MDNQRTQAQQIPVDSYDIVAVTIPGRQKDLVLIAAYDPGYSRGSTDQAKEVLADKMRKIGRVVEETRRMTRLGAGRIGVLICTDFNRHHPLWCHRVTLGSQLLSQGTPGLACAYCL